MFKIENEKIVLTTEKGEIRLDESPRQVILDIQMALDEFEENKDEMKEGEKNFYLGEEYPDEYIRKTEEGTLEISTAYMKAEYKTEEAKKRLADAIRTNMMALKTANIKMSKNAIRQINTREELYKETIEELES